MESNTKVKGSALGKNPDSPAIVTEGKTRHMAAESGRLVEVVVKINGYSLLLAFSSKTLSPQPAFSLSILVRVILLKCEAILMNQAFTYSIVNVSTI